MERTASLNYIDEVVGAGKTVVSADSSSVIDMVQEALKNGKSMTFYMSREEYGAVWRWYWTPRLIKEVGMEQVSNEEKTKIESELGFKCEGTWFSNRLECPCGGVYGMFEFMQQGLREHDRDWIKAVLELKNSAVLRVNPALDAFCPQDGQLLMGSHYYAMSAFPPGPGSGIYGCCRAQ